MLNKILLPLDGSDTSETALPCALELAQAHQATVLLTRIVEHLGDSAPGLPPEVVPELQRKAETKALNYLEARSAKFAPLEVAICTPTGAARDEIARLAEVEQCELIVMASHAHGGARHWLLGSVAEAVLRQAPCPVLLVRPQAPPAARFKQILVPVDGSSASLSVLEKLPALLAPGGRVTVLQSSGVSLYPNYAHKPEAVEEYLKGVEARLKELQHQDLPIEVVVLEGSPVEDILAWAEQNQVDLIAMTTHGRTGFRRFWLGSVCEKVARQASCHVLVYRPPHRSDTE